MNSKQTFAEDTGVPIIASWDTISTGALEQKPGECNVKPQHRRLFPSESA